ncbi:DUF481 domain-containing protein [Pseudomonas japonica]|uniref:DUF481 domain-containing protein n=1 Tax=Pseudomonas japonica TaxID=256466 RepID=UPI0015E2821C|nr:DUF481 domain-containing protein [Pseudomonas japonica]MBA1243890.1 DUF481 domain-containing protein [Pseudomonas japonica]MBA1288396.1 DUF481 domain-containing protein [Pseudomonas japonica]
MFPRTLLCVAVTCTMSSAFADTVWMKNGDRLTGTIKVFDGGKLMLDTPYGGSIPVDMKQVKTLETDQPLLVRQDAYDSEVAKSLKPADEGKVILANGDAPKTVELASIQQLMKPKPLVQDLSWKGNIDAALDFKRAETNTDDYNIAFKTTARHGRWRHIADGEYNRETEDGVTGTDNWAMEYSLDRFITDQWYWQGRLNYKHDNIEDIRRQRTVGTGPGYQFWDNELGAFSLGGLLNRTDYQFADDTKENFYSVALKWDYNRFLIGKTVELFSTGELGRPLSNVADYSLDAEVGLRYKVTEWASLNLKYEKDLITGTSDNNDLDSSRYTAGFGVTW